MAVRKRVVPCEIYSRVVGYFRPVDQWNLGKQDEFHLRKTLHVPDCNALNVKRGKDKCSCIS